MLETDFASETFYRKVHILIYTSSLIRHAVLKKIVAVFLPSKDSYKNNETTAKKNFHTLHSHKSYK